MLNVNEQFLNALADMFMQHNLVGVAEHFVYPIPLYTDDDLQVFCSAGALVKALVLYRDAISAIDVTKIIPRIVAEGMPVRGYANVWVEWDHLNSARQCQRTSQARYVFFNKSVTDFPRIEMVEYKVRAFPHLNPSTPRIATA